MRPDSGPRGSLLQMWLSANINYTFPESTKQTARRDGRGQTRWAGAGAPLLVQESTPACTGTATGSPRWSREQGRNPCGVQGISEFWASTRNPQSCSKEGLALGPFRLLLHLSHPTTGVGGAVSAGGSMGLFFLLSDRTTGVPHS